MVNEGVWNEFRENMEILEHAGSALTMADIRSGAMTPVFFGSAMNNFGVEAFLRRFLGLSVPPRSFESTDGSIEPTYPEFTAFVFKLQANMDPRHRDRVAFIRICSGMFKKDMNVVHARSAKTLQLVQPKKFFAQSRESIDHAYPGDIIGLNNPGSFGIGDTLYSGQKVVFPPLPSFAPDLFAYLTNNEPSKSKHFHKGVLALQEEGAIQVLQPADDRIRHPILAAIGRLQFEVVQYRLATEYGVETTLEPLSYQVARWVEGGWKALEAVRLHGAAITKDRFEQPVLLFPTKYTLMSVLDQNPNLHLVETPFVQSHG
jgi:peptide chain release factor 3